MREMKDSGIDWLGEMPSHWTIHRNKALFNNVSIKNHGNATVLSLYRELGVIPKDSRDDNHNVTSLDTDSYKYVEIGNLVINKMKAWSGSLGISDYDGIVSPAYYVCKVDYSTVSPRFIHHYLRNPSITEAYEMLSAGMRIGQWDLGIDDFMGIKIALPSIEEQERISQALDNAISKIDALIANQEAQIEKLEQYKHSLIVETVCNGLVSTDFIDKKRLTIRLKYLLKIRSGESIRNEMLNENAEYPVYGGGGRLGFFSNYNVDNNNLLIGRVGSCGQITRPVSKAWATDNALIVESKENIDYLYYILIAADLQKLNISNAQPLITGTKIKNHPVSYFPDLQIQMKIVSYLDEKCKLIDGLIEIKKKKIQDLQLYKKSSIYEYVTGKKEVV